MTHESEKNAERYLYGLFNKIFNATHNEELKQKSVQEQLYIAGRRSVMGGGGN